MLVLERREGEKIILGDPRHPVGTIVVVDISNGRVNLGLELPRSIPINREEVAYPAIPRIQEARA